MSSLKNIPARPNLELDKKAAKELKKLIQAGDLNSLERVSLLHPAFEGASKEEILSTKFTLRDAQLVIAREYGFESWSLWKDYVESHSKPINSAEFDRSIWAIKHKRKDQLELLLKEYPELTEALDKSGDRLISYTTSYANDPGAENLSLWTSLDCAEVLVKAGAKVDQKTCFRALETADTPMVKMFVKESAVPHTLRVVAAAGDMKKVKSFFNKDGQFNSSFGMTKKTSPKNRWEDPTGDSEVVADGFRFAVRHNHREVAEFLLERCADIDHTSMAKLERWKTRKEILDMVFESQRSINTDELLNIFQLVQRMRIANAYDNDDVEGFSNILMECPELLSKENEQFQLSYLELCGYGDNPEFARAILDRGASVIETKPDSLALAYAIDYGAKEMISIYSKIWMPNEDLPTQAGLGHFEKVKNFFDKDGKLISHKAKVYPQNEFSQSSDAILLHALGLALMNDQMEIAEFLIDHGADINGRWGQHEPASLLHEMAGNNRLSAVKFLIEKGCDPTIRDERFGAMPYGWAQYMQREEIFEYLRPYSVAKSLWASVDVGTIEDIEKHLEAGDDINELHDFIQVQSIPVLFIAVIRGDASIVDFLLDNGADATQLDTNRKNALFRLQSDSDDCLAIAKALIRNGCNHLNKTNKGQTAIDHAIESDLHKLGAYFQSL